MFSSLGKGMFANVVRARVLQDDAQGQGGQADGANVSGKEREVAIKIIRSQESMSVLFFSLCPSWTVN